MKVRVLLFGPLAEKACPELPALELQEGARAGDVPEALMREFPALGRQLQSVAIAVNASYAGWDRSLADGDIVALIPPVSGG
jgi:molybdopterin converting factor small subunit